MPSVVRHVGLIQQLLHIALLQMCYTRDSPGTYVLMAVAVSQNVQRDVRPYHALWNDGILGTAVFSFSGTVSCRWGYQPQCISG
jgi:hypothetical protein